MSVAIPLSELSTWLLASVRVLAVFTVAPVFGHSSVPRRVRMGLALAVSLVIAPGLESEVDFAAMETLEWIGVVVREVAIGLAMGFVASLIFAVFGVLGQFISIQGGLGAARVIDPQSGASTVVMGSLLQIFGILTFLAIDGHHALLQATVRSFEQIPIAVSGLAVDSFLAIARMGGVVFDVAVRLAAPVTVAMLVSNCAVGLLGRSIPQLNLMTLQLPLHVAILMLLVSLGAHGLIAGSAEFLLPWMHDLPDVVGGRP